MSVILETSYGDIIIDLYVEHCPNACKNFLKLCKIKYYNNCLFHNIQRDFIIQSGDPTNTGKGGESIYGILYGEQAKYFEDEVFPFLKHTKKGVVSMANKGPNLNASQFFITTGEDLHQLDEKHTIFGEVNEGIEAVMKINDVYTDEEGKPRQVVRIKHTIILDDPFPDPEGIQIPDRSPIPSQDQYENLLDEEEMAKIGQIDERSLEEQEEELKVKEAKSRSQVLEIIGDIPDADVKPPDNVLFVCKLNPVTTEEDLELIFSRFGEIRSCEVIKDWKTGDSLNYSFIEFAKHEDCENAYWKMDNVLIDDRRIHVDFSQSVSRLVKGNDGRTTRVVNQFADFNPKRMLGSKSVKSGLEIKNSERKGSSKYGMVFEDKEDEKKPHKRKHHSDREKEKKRRS